MGYDFAGWATKYGIGCSDGRTIMPNAFDNADGTRVPLLWNHQHNNAENVVGYVELESRPEGVYAYGSFNDSPSGMQALSAVKHGDIDSLSIFANQLEYANGNRALVNGGSIREVSLVLTGANRGAKIEDVITHSYEDGDAAIIHSGISLDLEEENDMNEEFTSAYDLWQSLTDEEIDGMSEEETEALVAALAEEGYDITNMDVNDDPVDDNIEHGDFVAIYNTMNEEQRNMVNDILVAVDLEEENNTMKHNAFGNESITKTRTAFTLSDLISTAKSSGGSLKESYLAHCDNAGGGDFIMHSDYVMHADSDAFKAANVKPVGYDDPYGVAAIETLFPDVKLVGPAAPEFIKRNTDWCSVLMNSCKHSPMSRIKVQFADITEEAARAKGYLKGNYKKNEIFSLLKRTTSPTTIYKKNKLDRDDWVDITDFDVVAWIKSEMKIMLNEEIARAVLIGDGRFSDDEDHIDTNSIRPIVEDHPLFVIRTNITNGNGVGTSTDSTGHYASNDYRARNFIEACIRSRKNYKGSGNPILFTTEDLLTDMLLLENTFGDTKYKNEGELCTKLRVSKIVTVEVLENFHDIEGYPVLGIIVNPNDYTIGADRGGSINMFDDFDINFNQMIYLMETRISGSLTKPFSAIVIREVEDSSSNYATPIMLDTHNIASATIDYKPVSDLNPASDKSAADRLAAQDIKRGNKGTGNPAYPEA